jgi:hypothetical protein
MRRRDDDPRDDDDEYEDDDDEEEEEETPPPPKKPSAAWATAKFLGNQLYRPLGALKSGTQALGSGVKNVLKFGTETAAKKGSDTFKQFVGKTAALRGQQRPGQSFVRRNQPKVYQGPRGCIDVRIFGGKTRKRRSKFYRNTRKRK